MAKLLVLYKAPADTAAFDRYYFDKHVPIAKKLPGLQHYEVNRGTVSTLIDPAPYHLIATLTFGSLAAIRAALASPEGEIVAADLANFAMAGVDILLYETQSI